MNYRVVLRKGDGWEELLVFSERPPRWNANSVIIGNAEIAIGALIYIEPIHGRK